MSRVYDVMFGSDAAMDKDIISENLWTVGDFVGMDVALSSDYFCPKTTYISKSDAELLELIYESWAKDSRRFRFVGWMYCLEGTVIQQNL